MCVSEDNKAPPVATEILQFTFLNMHFHNSGTVASTIKYTSLSSPALWGCLPAVNAVLCFVSNTLDLQFFGPVSLLPLFRACRKSPLWMGSPVNTSLCFFLPSVCKIMNSYKRVGHPLLYSLHLSWLCDRDSVEQ